MANEVDEDSQEGFHPFWFSIALAVGLIVLGAAFVIPSNWYKPAVFENLAVGVGTSLTLVGVLNFFSQKISRKVVGAANIAAKTVEDRVEERFGKQLSNLQERMNQRDQERADEQDEIINAIEQEATAQSVARALHLANRERAIHDGRIIVPAGPGPRHSRLEFAWGATEAPAQHAGSAHREPLWNRPKLLVGVDGDFVEWDEGISDVDAADNLKQKLIQQDKWDGRLEWNEAFQNLPKALKVALRARQKSMGALELEGRMREQFNEYIFFTTKGFEAPQEHVVFERGFFGNQPFPMRPNGKHRERLAARPEFLEAEDWKYILEVLPERLPKGPRWIPWGADDAHDFPW
ncbi:hypothetical protein [Glycomyces buryatensis]|uniref:Uncharacterized protein n=1 Tax=Glycomyces buryatensis TaxID=2570927 RepID=A0A4S8QAG9_9ACTN|nr:hypothetical protein [Glycomyces buryatensis]THV41260.1 hypothetical protein FAB82_12620 [Glycomyces buryatensis]